MNVEELIEKLKEMPINALVLINTSEDILEVYYEHGIVYIESDEDWK